MKTCEYCGTPMERKRYNGRLEDNGAFRKRRYCSSYCSGLGHMDEEPSLAALRKRYRFLRGDMCETCGDTTMLGLHHVDGNPAHNDSTNLMTLCASCHTKWHWEHGKTAPKQTSVCPYCDKPSQKLGMCQKHYQRFRKYGNPLMTKKKHGSHFVLVVETPGPPPTDNLNTNGNRPDSRQG